MRIMVYFNAIRDKERRQFYGVVGRPLYTHDVRTMDRLKGCILNTTFKAADSRPGVQVHILNN